MVSLGVYFWKKSHKFRKNLILGGDFGMLFLHKKRSKSFILSIYTLLEFTMFEKMLLFCFNFEMIRIYGIFEMMSLYGVFVWFFGYMTTGAYWSLQTTCTYGDFVRFFRLNDNSGFSRCLFFQIILFQIFIRILLKLS